MPQLDEGRKRVNEDTAGLRVEREQLEKVVGWVISWWRTCLPTAQKTKIVDDIGSKVTDKQRELIVLREDETAARDKLDKAQERLQKLEEDKIRKSELLSCLH